MDKLYLAGLLSIPNLGPAKARVLLKCFGSAQKVWTADYQDLKEAGLDAVTCNNLLLHREKLDLNKLSNRWTELGIKLCSYNEPDYPILLRHIANPPLLLYYRGELYNSDKNIAIVGSRRASSYGKNVAQMLGSELAAAGFTVVSGAARGIDTAAHLGALTQGRTIAVLGSGVDVVYPPENAKLLNQIAAQGAVISEYPPGTAPHARHFPARNRIISGMSRGVVIVEAAEKSGALITADFALEQGRDVFAVPGSVFSPLSKGTHNLIKQGAKLVEKVSDILEEYGVNPPVTAKCQDKKLSADAVKIYQALSCEHPSSLEEIVGKTQLPLATVTYLLLELELLGLVNQIGRQRYLRIAREGIN